VGRFRTFLSYAGIITTVEARAEALRRVSKSVLSENDAAHNEDHARGKNEVNRLQFVGSCASLLQDTTDEVIVAAAKVFGAALSACEKKNEVDCTLAARRIDNHAKLVLPATFVWMNLLSRHTASNPQPFASAVQRAAIEPYAFPLRCSKSCDRRSVVAGSSACTLAMSTATTPSSFPSDSSRASALSKGGTSCASSG
jgi:hypothetical protein